MIKRIIITTLTVSILAGCAKKIEFEEEKDSSEVQEDSSVDESEYAYQVSPMAQVGEDSSSDQSFEEHEDSDYSQTAVSNYSSNNGNSNCYGSDSYYTCDDLRTGNTYQISKYGNTTEVQGSNSSTGSSWSQTTNTYGDTSYTTGYDKDGNSWDQTTTHYGHDSYSYSGTDSDGNSFSGSCSYGTCSSY